MPQNIINIKPRAIKITDELVVERPRTIPFAGVGVSSFPNTSSRPTFDASFKFESGSSVGVG